MKIKIIKSFILQMFCIKQKEATLNEKVSIKNDKSIVPISLSTASSSSDTRPSTPISNARGIFRTLEPVWYYHASLLPPNPNQQQEWLRFDDHNQYTLETSLLQSKPECSLYKTSFGPCSIQFKPVHPERHSVMFFPPSKNVSMPTLRPRNNRSLELNKDVRRVISPVWWFEQDSADGSKGMCRFDDKNQIRLEALSDGRNRLVLSDDAFHGTFMVVLEAPAHRELKEEVRGFLYFESNAPQVISKKNRFLMEGFVDEEDWNPNLARRYSV